VSSTLKHIEDPRLTEILEVIFSFAAGDLKARGRLSDDDSAMDGVMAGASARLTSTPYIRPLLLKTRSISAP